MNKKSFVPWVVSICGLIFLVASCTTSPRGFPPVNGIANFEMSTNVSIEVPSQTGSACRISRSWEFGPLSICE